MSLSDRIRANSEAAPWVIEEVVKMEAEIEHWRDEAKHWRDEAKRFAQNVEHWRQETGWRNAEIDRLLSENIDLEKNIDAIYGERNMCEQALSDKDIEIKRLEEEAQLYSEKIYRLIGDLNEAQEEIKSLQEIKIIREGQIGDITKIQKETLEAIKILQEKNNAQVDYITRLNKTMIDILIEKVEQRNKVELLQEKMNQIAEIAHNGGLQNLSEGEALIEIRKLSLKENQP